MGLTPTTLLFASEFFIAVVKLLGNRWTSQHGTTPSPEWQRLLAPFAHLDPEQVAAQLVRKLQPNARGEVWAPVMADVIAMCRPKPSDFGLPTAEQAYRAANHLRWTHPVVYETARRLGVSDVRSRTDRQALPDFTETYEIVCEEFMAGKTRNWPQRAKPEAGIGHDKKPRRPATPDEAKARCDALRKALGPMPPPLGKDTPPPPINDDDFASRQEAENNAIAEAAERYHGAAQ